MRIEIAKYSLLAVLTATTGYSAPSRAQSEDALLNSIRSAGRVKVAIGSAPPWSVVSPTGEATGYTVEILGMALKGMGLPAMEATLTAWNAMVPGLQARQFDMVAPGLTITEARCKVVLYSAPVFVMQDGLYVLPGNPKRLTSYAQVAQSPAIKLAVVTGSSQEAYALKQGVKTEQLVRVTDIQAGAATVTGGRANAFAVGQFTITNPQQRGLEVVVDKQSTVNAYGVAFRKEDVRFRDALNKQFDVLRSNGAMMDLYAVKYGVPNWDVLSKLSKASDAVSSCE